MKLAFANYQAEIGNYELFQYMIGVVPDYPMADVIFNYKYDLQQKFGNSVTIIPLAYRFENNEFYELKNVLQELSDYYKAEINVDDMFSRSVQDRDNRYYLVFTIVGFKILYSK